MKQKKNKYTKCGCCGQIKDKLDVSICLSVLKNTDFIKNSDQKYDLYEWLINSNFEWTCDKCINDRKALIANPSQQNNTYNPFLAYYSVNLICKKCGVEFTFTKEEKKLWYEELKFFRESEPLNCLKCRKEIKVFKIQNKIVSQILKKSINEISIEELSQLVEIYDKWNKKDKFNFYSKVIERGKSKNVAKFFLL